MKARNLALSTFLVGLLMLGTLWRKKDQVVMLTDSIRTSAKREREVISILRNSFCLLHEPLAFFPASSLLLQGKVI
jgi:hypothetical protein